MVIAIGVAFATTACRGQVKQPENAPLVQVSPIPKQTTLVDDSSAAPPVANISPCAVAEVLSSRWSPAKADELLRSLGSTKHSVSELGYLRLAKCSHHSLENNPIDLIEFEASDQPPKSTEQASLRRAVALVLNHPAPSPQVLFFRTAAAAQFDSYRVKFTPIRSADQNDMFFEGIFTQYLDGGLITHYSEAGIYGLKHGQWQEYFKLETFGAEGVPEQSAPYGRVRLNGPGQPIQVVHIPPNEVVRTLTYNQRTEQYE